MGNSAYTGTKTSQISERELRHAKLARKLAAEGIVLLKNDGILPLHKSAKTALLGKGANKTVKGGIGSGDVNNRKNVSIYEGLCAKNISITSESWIQDYDERYKNARLNWKDKIYADLAKYEYPFDAYANNPFSYPEGRKISFDDIKEAESVIYVISRIAGEGKDRRCEKGDYYLSEQEKQDIHFIGQHKPIILVINAGGAVEITDILASESAIKAVLYIGQPGQEGGHAVADILFGDEVPSGRLTATWAEKYSDYPYSDEYSYLNGNLQSEEYKEGIYVGYRYFETFDIKTCFSFGHGLSYTTFETSLESIHEEEYGIKLKVLVKNTGDVYTGKEVVQCYIELPKSSLSGMDKEICRLAAFSKTKKLAPGESEVLELKIQQKSLASYRTDTREWSIEQGTYGVSFGKSASLRQVAAQICVADTTVIEKTGEVCAPAASFTQLKSNHAGYQKKEDILSVTYLPKKEKIYNSEQKYADSQSIEELLPLLIGNISATAGNIGASGTQVPGSAGETSINLYEKYHIPSLVMADGPAGLRLRQSYEVNKETGDIYGIGVFGSLENGYLEPMEYHDNADLYYQYCTAFPVGTVIAQTWSETMAQEFGKAVSEEMQEFHVQLWLAPGMNIHRNPLCGRNFEYYSEDCYLSGMIAAAVTKGVQGSKGCGVTIKHFACNNQEDNRMGVDSIVSERALREIYFRGFELAVKEAKPVAVMTSYNLINGIHAANSHDLCTKLLREEWGYNGIVMSDWNTTGPADGSIPWKCAMAGNDIIMPGNEEDMRNIEKAYKSGELTETVIRQCAGRIIDAALQLTEKM